MRQAGLSCLPHSMYQLFRPLYLFALLLAGIAAAQESGSPRTSRRPTSVQPGLDLAKRGQCTEALPLLKKSYELLKEKETRREAGLAGVRCAMLRNQFDTALDFLRRLNREFPTDPEVLYVTVHTYSDLSTRAAQQLATTAPNSAQAGELNAESLEMQGKWEAAQKQYQALLQQNPSLPGIHFRIGRLLLSRPDAGPTAADDAKKEFQEELKIDPNNAGAEYVLGELARQAQQWDEAVQHFSHAAKLDTSFGDAFLGLGSTLISQKKFSDAVSPLEIAVKLEPQNPTAHYSLAMAYARSGRKEDADKEFRVHRNMIEKSGGSASEPASQPPANPQ
jgi:tetratricopeptide (TPR) repeat protein